MDNKWIIFLLFNLWVIISYSQTPDGDWNDCYNWAAGEGIGEDFMQPIPLSSTNWIFYKGWTRSGYQFFN